MYSAHQPPSFLNSHRRRPAIAIAAAVFAATVAARAATPSAHWGEKIGSVHAVLGKATAEARKWSRNPRLLAVIGVGPGGSRPEEREVWIFTYADADHATSTFKVRVSDGIVSSAREILPIWTEDSADFALRGCLPIDVKFLDTPQVVARAGKQNLPPTEYRQSYYLTLVRPASDNCGGSEGTFGDMDGYIDKFPQLRPYPRGAVHRAVWVIVNDEEALFLDAKTGETLARRRFRKQRPAGPVADE